MMWLGVVSLNSCLLLTMHTVLSRRLVIFCSCHTVREMCFIAGDVTGSNQNHGDLQEKITFSTPATTMLMNMW